MKFAELIQVFPQVLKNNSEMFKLEDLQDLDKTLTALDNQPEAEVVEQVKAWFKTHTEARDTLIQFASANRELKTSPPLPPSSEVSILQNLFELRQTNQDILKAKNNQAKTEKSDVKK
jgi:hypothetical protein